MRLAVNTADVGDSSCVKRARDGLNSQLTLRLRLSNLNLCGCVLNGAGA